MLAAEDGTCKMYDIPHYETQRISAIIMPRSHLRCLRMCLAYSFGHFITRITVSRKTIDIRVVEDT